MQFFEAFGVSLTSLLAQLVNFVLLMAILYKFAYKPLLKFMDERKARIAKGVEDAKVAAQALSNSKEEHARVLVEARKEAAGIVDAARQTASQQAAKIVAQAKEEVSRVIAEGKQTLEAERISMVNAAKKDVINMVVASTEKVLQGVVDDKVDQTWLKAQLAKVK